MMHIYIYKKKPLKNELIRYSLLIKTSINYHSSFKLKGPSWLALLSCLQVLLYIGLMSDAAECGVK
ncbi:hypothetical protein EPIR_2885 [Erwinia piriflorinigrans CFBP 5888]|uniref:Uncharacterized protein n=1 Tax=Erwinia piriflorinigrans CFBP 5888 TaxID=1161919 RepID=V5ZA59_9GAMM|nr:hypothetical protein EPIR_2885 [Erwinia piriflorinigrans CFBP 5888]